MTRWTKEDELEELLTTHATGFVLKHSTRCSISAEALREFEAFERDEPDAPVFLVLVIESRPLSNAISEKLGIPHASPQAIFLRNGAVVWQASHWDITREALKGAWKSQS